MSAINPASFASPTLGIQAPSGVGPGAVGVGRSSSNNNNERRQSQQHQEPQAPAFTTGGQAGRGYRPGMNQPYGGDRNVPPNQGYPNYGYAQGGAFGNARASGVYGQALSPNVDGFATGGFQQLGDFQPMRNRFPTPGSVPSPTPHSQGVSPIAPQNDWATAFQGLSLNSH